MNRHNPHAHNLRVLAGFVGSGSSPRCRPVSAAAHGSNRQTARTHDLGLDLTDSDAHALAYAPERRRIGSRSACLLPASPTGDFAPDHPRDQEGRTWSKFWRRAMGGRVVTLSAVILVTACGGGATGPSSIVGVTLVGADPPPGSTITVSSGNASLSMTFSVVSDKEIPLPFPTVEWVGGGSACGVGFDSGADWSPTLKANEPRTLTVHTVVIQGQNGVLICPLPTTTSVVRVRVQQFCVSSCNGGEPSFARELPISYTFRADVGP
jgi:hypothetical protein